jgi:hypothetical protein
MREHLNEFFDSSLRNTWIESRQMKVYVRKGGHLGTDRQIHHFLDIASVEVYLKYRHQGHFKAFLALCQEIQPYDGILVEIVLDDHLRAYLRRLAQEDTRWTERGQDFLWENAAEKR